MSMPQQFECRNCHKVKRVYSFRVMTVEKSRSLTFNMRMCAECAQQLIDVLTIAAIRPPEALRAE